jgi:hypothetical protein
VAKRERCRGASFPATSSPLPLDDNLLCFRLASVGAIASLMSVASMAHCEAPVERKGLAVDRQAVRELRQRLSDLLATSEEARWLDDGDYTLHRFLVSRNHDLAAAETMFRGTVKWRTRHNVRGELHAWRQHGCTERQQASLYEYAVRCGHTSLGHPLNVERVGQYDIAGCVRVPGMTDLVAKAYIMYLEETFQDVRAASVSQGSYVRAKVVSDASGVGLAHVHHSRFMRDVIKVGQQNYPECVESVLVVRAPRSMHTLWNFGVKWMLPERSKAKVQIAGSHFEAKLTEMGVSLSALPPFLGGSRADAAAQQAEAMAQRVPDTAVVVPPVSLFGRQPAAHPSESPAAHTTRLGSLRDGMAGIAAWCTSSADA